MTNSIVPNVVKSYKGRAIRIREDKYVCLSDMATASGKRLNNWIQLQSTSEYLSAFELATGEPVAMLLEIENGITTWAHPEIAIKFEGWCNKTKNKKSDYLYVFTDAKRKVCKIGISSNPDRRLQVVQVGYPWDLTLAHSVKVINACLTEKKLHDKFADFRLRGEWFDLQVVALIDWGEIS